MVSAINDTELVSRINLAVSPSVDSHFAAPAWPTPETASLLAGSNSDRGWPTTGIGRGEYGEVAHAPLHRAQINSSVRI